jgi:hypothetical protein
LPTMEIPIGPLSNFGLFGRACPALVAGVGSSVPGAVGRPCHFSGKITFEFESESSGSLNMGFAGKKQGT